MSTSDSPADQPRRSPPPSAAGQRSARSASLDRNSEATNAQTRRASPALRLSAWIMAFVLFLLILGLALAGLR